MFFRTVCLACLLTLCGFAVAQQTAPTPDSSIRLSVVVKAGTKGEPIGGLAQSSFTVLDNGTPEAMTSFRSVSAPAEPTNFLLVVDAINIPYERLAFERQQLNDFLRRNDGHLAQPTSLAIVSDTDTQVEPGFSREGNAIADALAKQVTGLRELRRSSGFYGAEERLDLSLKSLQQLVAKEAGKSGRTAIVWITPGWPLLSGPEVDLTAKEQNRLFQEVVQLNDLLQKSCVTLYVLDPLGASESPARSFYFEEFLKPVTKPSQTQIGDLGAQVLAVKSGGLFLGNSNDLVELFQRAYADAVNRYEISYQAPPAEKANEYHRIDVKLNEPGLVGRTLQGYYAEPSGSR